jgi:uncharacterized protein YbaR (Trm112 family)/SAM-dependent methyltransferase
MRIRLLKWLVCPICHDELRVLVKESQPLAVSAADLKVLSSVAVVKESTEVEEDVVTGALACDNCGVYYPIHNAVPRMLTYVTGVARLHSERFQNWIRTSLAGLRLPDMSPPQGEEAVLRNFSREWQEYRWSGNSYWQATPEHMMRCMRYVLGFDQHSFDQKLILDVGMGIGGIADGVTHAAQCEVIGMDLGYAADAAWHYFGGNPRLHLVQASLFAPPFRHQTFDVVYSQGVLHHTYSTEAAFQSIAKLPKSKSGMLCVWVYSHERENVTWFRRFLMSIEKAARPMVARLPGWIQTALLLPTLPLYMMYQNLYRRPKFGSKNMARYGWNEALHAARDRLTPPFAHRHTYEEVAEWFRSQGYGELELLRDEPLPAGIPDNFPLAVGIRGIRGEHATEDTSYQDVISEPQVRVMS